MDVASQSGRETPPLNALLFERGHSFDFFQAVRILESLARNERQAEAPIEHQPVGHDHQPEQEVVRFRVLPSLSFSAGPVHHIHKHPPTTYADKPVPLAEMIVTFMGLTGPQGVLPNHYTSLVIERCHVTNKDETLKDFLDMFNHRTLSLFFRAWEKYRFPFAYERYRLDSVSGNDDLFTFCLYCLVGLGTQGLRRRLHIDDESVLYYGGHFAHKPRSAIALESILSDYFGVPAMVRQFCGRWLYLSGDLQSKLPSRPTFEGLNCELGKNLIAGKRAWDVQGKFRIRLGPLGYKDFLKFIPIGEALRRLCELVRLYVGPEFTYDVEVVLKAAEVPRCRLRTKSDELGTHLAWNSWLRTSRTFSEDADDAVFRIENY